MKVEFAPLSIPLHRRLETFAMVIGVSFMLFSPVLGIIVLLYLILYTSYWLEALIYIVWISVIDIDICDKGGRRQDWVVNAIGWKYFVNYFPVRAHKTSKFELDPNRNYLFGCFPHGILAFSFFAVFLTKWGGYREFFPAHKPYLLTLKQNFLIPLLRDLLIAGGFCSVTEKSINYLLSQPKGGNSVALIVGGAAEVFESKPGAHIIVLKKRKGFVKLALINGSPLVPVYSFGETDSYRQLNNPEGSLVRSIQEWVKGKTGIAPPIPLGRGIFQYSFGVIPHRRPMNVVFGEPIEVERTQFPSQEQIDELHKKFMERMITLFNENKHKFVENGENVQLIVR